MFDQMNLIKGRLYKMECEEGCKMKNQVFFFFFLILISVLMQTLKRISV